MPSSRNYAMDSTGGRPSPPPRDNSRLIYYTYQSSSPPFHQRLTEKLTLRPLT